MATTRIMPLHVGKGRTESRAISDIIDYVANPKKTDNGRLITGYACDSRTADAEFLLAKRQYIAATLRYYDQIGLLRPAGTASNGYRFYGPEEVDRLQQILFYRELGMPLDEIRRLLDAPGFNREKALEEHLAALVAKRERRREH